MSRRTYRKHNECGTRLTCSREISYCPLCGWLTGGVVTISKKTGKVIDRDWIDPLISNRNGNK